MYVTALNLHPVKSTAVRPVTNMEITPAGPRGDREWIVVDGDGVMVSARELRSLFTVTARTPATDPGVTCALRLTAPGHPSLNVEQPRGRPEAVRLFRHDLQGVAAGPAADAWLRHVLGRDDVRLLWCDDPTRRSVGAGEAATHARFPDAYPVTIATETSLTQLNAWVALVAREHGEEPQTIPMERFRPNIVLDGAEPFAEDDWGSVRIGAVELAVVKPVDRCVMTTVDPATLTSGREPLRTLARFRRPERQTLFCVHAVPRTTGTIAVGDLAESAP